MSDQHRGADQGGGDPPKKSGVPGLRVPPGFENLAASRGTGAGGRSGKCSVGDVFCPRGLPRGQALVPPPVEHTEQKGGGQQGRQPRVVQHSWITEHSAAQHHDSRPAVWQPELCSTMAATHAPRSNQPWTLGCPQTHKFFLFSWKSLSLLLFLSQTNKS